MGQLPLTEQPVDHTISTLSKSLPKRCQSVPVIYTPTLDQANELTPRKAVVCRTSTSFATTPQQLSVSTRPCVQQRIGFEELLQAITCTIEQFYRQFSTVRSLALGRTHKRRKYSFPFARIRRLHQPNTTQHSRARLDDTE